MTTTDDFGVQQKHRSFIKSYGNYIEEEMRYPFSKENEAEVQMSKDKSLGIK